jgi:hypothetical protein
MDWVILVAAVAAAVFGAWGIWLQVRPLLSVSWNAGSMGPDRSNVSVYIRNDGASTVPNVRVVGVLDGQRIIEPQQHQGEPLGRDRMTQFDLHVPVAYDELGQADLVAEISYGRIWNRTKRVPWNQRVTLH